MPINELSILIVDDEASIRSGLANIIDWKSLGITVLETAENGLEAYDLIKTYAPDIVLTDIRMPKCDGLTLIEMVKKENLPVTFVIISGYDDFQYAQKAIKYGVNSYLLKPIKIDILTNEIQEICEKILISRQNESSAYSTRRRLKLSLSALRDQFFHSLIQNEYHTKEEILDKLERCNLSITDSSFNIFIFAYGMTDDPTKYVFSKDDALLFRSSVRNIIEELLGANQNATFTDANGYIVAIVQTPYHDDDPETYASRICHLCIKTVMDFCGISMWAGIGVECLSLLEAKISYITALECLSYRIHDTDKCVFNSTILSHTAPSSSYSNAVNNKQLIDAIYRGSVADMHTYTNQFFESLFYISFPPPAFIRGMCIYLIVDVQKGLSTYLPENKKLFSDKTYGIINEIHSFKKIKRWIQNLFSDYISYINENSTLKNDAMIDSAKNYIHAHIFEKITAENVALHVHLSEKYFTNYFKEKTNENFKTYLLKLKIEEATELLKIGELSIAEIAYKLGYTDYRAFNRIFKKITHQTPSEYQGKYIQKGAGG